MHLHGMVRMCVNAQQRSAQLFRVVCVYKTSERTCESIASSAINDVG
jgi:hypothetical protein